MNLSSGVIYCYKANRKTYILSMKLGISITMHWSDKIRPKGDFYIKNIIESIEKNIIYDYTIYVIDNQSQYQIDLSQYKNIVYEKILDQSLEGLTGAWNKGIYLAYQDKCDIIINSNDDLILNKEVNDFVNFIYNDSDKEFCVYGPQPSNGLPLESNIRLPNKGFNFITPCLNGYFFGISKEHYEKFSYKPNKYFNQNNKYNGGDGKWGGQEGQFIENSEKGCKFKVLNFCWIEHFKERAWKKAKNMYS